MFSQRSKLTTVRHTPTNSSARVTWPVLASTVLFKYLKQDELRKFYLDQAESTNSLSKKRCLKLIHLFFESFVYQTRFSQMQPQTLLKAIENLKIIEQELSTRPQQPVKFHSIYQRWIKRNYKWEFCSENRDDIVIALGKERLWFIRSWQSSWFDTVGPGEGAYRTADWIRRRNRACHWRSEHEPEWVYGQYRFGEVQNWSGADTSAKLHQKTETRRETAIKNQRNAWQIVR